MTEIMTNGPVEGAFTVFADFPNYKSGLNQFLKNGKLIKLHIITSEPYCKQNKAV